MMWAFTIFYGLTFVISDEGMDSSRYKYKFIELSRETISFTEYASTFYDEEGQTADVVDPTIQYVLSRFTDNPRILFGTYGLIFGFFYSRNLFYILNRLQSKLKPGVVLLIVSFALLAPIWDLNGFRFNTAIHIYLFGLLPFLFEQKKKWIWVSAATVFMHFSWVFPVLILLVYLIMGNRLYIFFFFFIISMFVSEVNVGIIGNTIEESLPKVFHQRSTGYIGEEKVEAFKESTEDNRNWYVTAHRNALKWVIIIFMSVIFFQSKDYLKKHKGMLRLLCFTLLFYGCANVSSLVPSGARFIVEANLLALAFIILYVQNGPKETLIDKLIPFTIPVLLLFIIVKIRMGFDSIGVISIFGNPLFLFFFDTDVALITLFK